jgi:adenosylhomocysteine nucleosidase
MVLPQLLRTLLQQAAGQKVRETVMEAARQQLDPTSRTGESATDNVDESAPPIGVVFAIGSESGGLEDLLHDVVDVRAAGFTVRRGGLGQRPVIIAISGAGRKRAADATEALILGHRPRLVISAGFAGGLVDDLKRNDVVVGDSVRTEDGANAPLDAMLLPAGLRGSPRLFSGRLLTVDRVIHQPAEKRSLGSAHAALAVDMETAAVAEVCRIRQIPLLAVRVIIDAVEDQLPPDLERVLSQKTGAGRLGAALGIIVNRPSSAKDLYNLKEAAIVASARLAKFLAATIEHLGPSHADPSRGR